MRWPIRPRRRWPQPTSVSRSRKRWPSSWSSSCVRCAARSATSRRLRRTERMERLRWMVDESGVAEVVLDRPPANAIDLVTLAELKQAAEALSLDTAVRVGLLKSAREPIFAGGFDLDFLGESWDEMLPMIRAFHEAADAWVRIPSPTIAVIGGHAAGGGCRLAVGL